MITAMPSRLEWSYCNEQRRLCASGSQLTADFIQIRRLIETGNIPRDVSAIVYKADEIVMFVRGRYLQEWISAFLPHPK